MFGQTGAGLSLASAGRLNLWWRGEEALTWIFGECLDHGGTLSQGPFFAVMGLFSLNQSLMFN